MKKAIHISARAFRFFFLGTRYKRAPSGVRDGHYQLDISHLPTGLYLLEVTGTNSSSYTKFFKQ